MKNKKITWYEAIINGGGLVVGCILWVLLFLVPGILIYNLTENVYFPLLWSFIIFLISFIILYKNNFFEEKLNG